MPTNETGAEKVEAKIEVARAETPLDPAEQLEAAAAKVTTRVPEARKRTETQVSTRIEGVTVVGGTAEDKQKLHEAVAPLQEEDRQTEEQILAEVATVAVATTEKAPNAQAIEQIRAALPAELIADLESELDINPPGTSAEARESLESDPRYQRAYAKCCSYLTQSIFENRNVPLEQLEALAGNFGTAYHFTEGDSQKVQSLIQRYDELRTDADRTREEFANDTDLVKRLTEVDVPVGTKLDIDVGAVSINITTDEETAGLLFTDGKERLKLLTDCRIGGYAFKTNDTVPINYTVLVEGRSQQVIKRHEEQHIVNKRLFMPEFEPVDRVGLGLRKEKARERLKEAQDESEKIELYKDIMLAARESALGHMKDELVAVVRAGYLPATKARIVGQERDAYDWLNPLRKEEIDELWPGLSQRILVEEYREIVEHSFEAAESMARLPNFSIDDVTALLNTNPLSEWPDIAKRQQETFKEARTG